MSIDTKEWSAKRTKAFYQAGRTSNETWQAETDVLLDLIRAVIADEAAKLPGKTICTYPVAPEGDVPEWFGVFLPHSATPSDPVAIFEYSSDAHKWASVAYDGKGTLIKPLLRRASAEFQAAERDNRIAELEAECERLRNARCNIFSKGNKCDCTLCKQDAELAALRQQLADATRPVDSVKCGSAATFNQELWVVPHAAFVSERNAREAAEAERDELREFVKNKILCMTGGICEVVCRFEAVPDAELDKMLAAYRAEKGKVAG